MIIQFVILPSINSWKENSAKAKTMRSEVAEMRAIVDTKHMVQKQIDATKAALKKMDGNIPLPVLGNYLLGMEQYIRACSQELDVKLSTIAYNDTMSISPDISEFKIYRVRVKVLAGFNEYINLVRNIHAASPFCSISNLNILPRTGSPLTHNINFIVGWLIWSDPENRPEFLIEGEK
ncbi:hypothetical protein ACFLQL_01450 [Verrucomicrobiota bacterium]